jgi:hypothetical protein
MIVTARTDGAKKGRRTATAPETPTKGHSRTAWPTPLSGRGPVLLLLFKSLAAQVGRFSGSSWTLARRSSCLHSRAVSTPGEILLLNCREITYRLPVVKRRQDHALVGWEIPRRKAGSIWGATARKASNTDPREGSLGRRFATRSALPTQASIILAQAWGNPHRLHFPPIGSLPRACLRQIGQPFTGRTFSYSGLRTLLRCRLPLSFHAAGRPDHRQAPAMIA